MRNMTKPSRPKSHRVVFLFFLFCLSPVFGESALTDPLIPDGEWTVISVQEEDEESTLRGQVRIGGSGKDFYNVVTTAPGERTELSLNRNTMTTLSVRTVRDMSGYRIESSTMVEGLPRAAEDEIRILDTAGLVYALRGFPFSSPRELRITFLSSDEDDDSGFNLSVDLAGRETLSISGRDIPCYRLELSFEMSGVFSVFMRMVPKTKLWYSVENPHYLVRYEGQSGPPGSPVTTMELIDYSGWN